MPSFRLAALVAYRKVMAFSKRCAIKLAGFVAAYLIGKLSTNSKGADELLPNFVLPYFFLGK